MEDKKYSMCRHLINKVRNNKLITTILTLDRSLLLEDLVSEVYLHHQKKGIYPNGVTVNRFMIDFCKKQFKASKLCNSNIEWDANIEDFVDPQATSRDREDYITLREAFKNLNEQDKKLIQMYYYEGYTMGEIADSLGLVKMSVKFRLDKVLKKLRKYYD
ncbi:MAG: sigma-70 family RNA polymerase sigma factor [Cetobacterium sp.]